MQLMGRCSHVALARLAGVMPLQKDFVTAGRYELKRVVERWGGSAELAAVAGYQVPLDDLTSLPPATVILVAASRLNTPDASPLL